MGGGTGIYPVTQALKHLSVEVSSIIAVSDSGGSSGKIRDEFGFQPVGDLRQSLAALAEDSGQEWIRKLLLYRFAKGAGLKGHNLGNLILTALQDMTGDTAVALEKATQIFRLNGTVIPATKAVVDLEIKYEDGSTQVGEDYLNPEEALNKQVVAVSLQPKTPLHPLAIVAIKKADAVIIGPGDLYASLLATLLPTAVPATFHDSSAKIIYIVNLMTRHHQTDGMTAADHVHAIEKNIGKKVDSIILHAGAIPESILESYQASQEFPIVDDLEGDPRVIRADIIADVEEQQASGDALHRSYLRHDTHKLRRILEQLLT